MDTVAAGFALMLAAVAISHYQIMCHLRNYTEPLFQRYIIRILYMVPVYAVGSWCSLKWHAGGIYFDTIRDCYEAYVIYNFMALLLAYVGGPGAVVVASEGKVVRPSWAHMTCCLPPLPVDGFLLRRCKQLCLQFVLAKPVMAALTLLLYAAGAYTDGDMSPSNGYFYISIAYNVCYTLALMGLVLFWSGASELLAPFNPLLKFIVVKTVVFLTFWQGLVISGVNSAGKLTGPEQGKAVQDFLILGEMVLAAVGMLYGFPHAEYSYGGAACGLRWAALAHAASVRDVAADVAHAFGSLYSDYVLYTDGGPASNVKRKKYRGHKQHVPSAAADEAQADGEGGGSGGGAGGGSGTAPTSDGLVADEWSAEPAFSISNVLNLRLVKKLAERLAAMDAAAARAAAAGAAALGAPGLPAAAAQGRAALEGGARAARRVVREELARAARTMELHRNAAMLVDSDSDGLDEDDGAAGFAGGGADRNNRGGREADGGSGDEEEGGGGRGGRVGAAAAAVAGQRVGLRVPPPSSSSTGEGEEAEEEDESSSSGDDETDEGQDDKQEEEEEEREEGRGPPALPPPPAAAAAAGGGGDGPTRDSAAPVGKDEASSSGSQGPRQPAPVQAAPPLASASAGPPPLPPPPPKLPPLLPPPPPPPLRTARLLQPPPRAAAVVTTTRASSLTRYSPPRPSPQPTLGPEEAANGGGGGDGGGAAPDRSAPPV